MTLKQFKIDFPKIFREYQNSRYAIAKKMPVLDRIYNFLDSKSSLRINFVQDPYSNFCQPHLEVDGEKVYIVQQRSEREAMKLVISKALCYLEYGIVE